MSDERPEGVNGLPELPPEEQRRLAETRYAMQMRRIAEMAQDRASQNETYQGLQDQLEVTVREERGENEGGGSHPGTGAHGSAGPNQPNSNGEYPKPRWVDWID